MSGNYDEYRVAFRPVVHAAFEPGRRPLPAQRVAAVCDDLLARAGRLSSLYLANSPLVARAEVVTALVRRSYGLRHDDPHHATRIARLAWRIANHLRSATGQALVVLDAQVEALANLGNLERVRENYLRAKVLLGRALAMLANGGGSASRRALVLEFQASLLRAQRAFAEAVEILREAASLYEKVADEANVGRVRLLHSYALYQSAEPREALRVLRSALPLLHAREEPGLGVGALHNYILYLEADGQHQLALALAVHGEDYFRALGSPSFLHRTWWVKGRLFSAVGNHSEAARYLEAAKNSFVERKLPYIAALVTLDLALVFARLGRRDIVAQLASEAQAVFSAKGIPREATAAFLLFAQAAREWRADVALVENLVAQLTPLRRASGF